MKKYVVHSLILALTACIASPAHAEIREGMFSLSPFVGGYTFDGSQHLHTDIATGGRLGYSLTKNWELEAQFTHVPLTTRNDPHSTTGHLYAGRGAVAYNFNADGRLNPFLSVGPGFSKTTGYFDDNMAPTFDYGGGVKYSFNDWLGVRADVRNVLTFQHSTPTSGGVYVWQNIEYTVGLSFNFGGKGRAATPAVQEASLDSSAPSSLSSPPDEPLHPSLDSSSVTLAERTGDAAGGGRAISAVRMGKNALEIVANEPIRNYRVFTLTQPSRLLIDIGNFTNGLGLDNIPMNHLGISNIRVVGSADSVRIVLESAQGDILPYRIQETPQGLKVILTPGECAR